MIKRMVTSAVFAGFVAGLFAAALQFVFVQPILTEAELYESGAKTHFAVMEAAGHDHDHAAVASDVAADAGGAGGHSVVAHDQAAPSFAAFDLQRNGLTVLFKALEFAGYALLLVAGFALAELRGERVAVRAGLIWGLAGFIALQFAPAIGLAPELPGMAAGDLTGRQLWWAATAVCTAGGLWLIAFGRNWSAWGAAVALLLLPHLIGAPEAIELTGPTPPELSAEFVGRALGVGMAGWALLGLLAATLWRRAEA